MPESINAPKRALAFLRWFCPDQLVEGIEGDLVEQFEKERVDHGLVIAKRKFWWRVMRFFRSEIILRNKLSYNSNFMFRNYLTIATRNLSRNKGYSAINIAGLGIGIACSLVIFLFVYGEWSYDKGFEKSGHIYRIGISFFNIGKFAPGPEELLDVLPKEFNGIETATRVQKATDVIINTKQEKFVESSVFYTDTAYFKIFNYDFVEGSDKNILATPNEAVITQKLAKTYFGRSDVLGEIIEVGKEKTPYTITGVVRNLSFNSHLQSELWLSNQSKITGEPAWTSAAFHNYVLLKENVTEANLQEALNSMYEHHVFPESGKPMGFKTLEDYRKNDISIKFYVHALEDIYLKSRLNFDLSPGGNEENIYIFSGVSIFVLLLAAINFINLTTARASRRAKEVGVRKSLGTSRRSLVNQFLIESMFTSVLALLLSVLLAEGFLASFHFITGKVLLNTIWQSPLIVLSYIGFALMVGLVSGFYPSFVISSFNTVDVLKGNSIFKSGSFFRNGLVVFQFTISILLIICTLVVQEQIQFIKTKDLGFNQENVITIDNAKLLKQSVASFKNELSEIPGVLQSSIHTGEPGSKRVMTMATYTIKGMEHPLSIATYYGDEGYLLVNGMKLVEGRDFNRDLSSDSLAVILNESAVKALGLQGNVIGTEINGGQKVIGVVSNFHWESLRNEIAPLVILPQYNRDFFELSFKLDAEANSKFMEALQTKWKKFVPDEPLKYHFLDENFGTMAKNEDVLEKMILFFTTLAILISCLGLFGLAAYTAEQRTKEIGIRKVLGATSSSITIMLNRKFSLLVIVSILLASPIAYYFMDSWLKGFAYHIELSIGFFIAGGLISMSLAWLTAGYHALKASTNNPTESLKHE